MGYDRGEDDWDDFLTEKKCSNFPSPIDIANATRNPATEEILAFEEIDELLWAGLRSGLFTKKEVKERIREDLDGGIRSQASVDKAMVKLKEVLAEMAKTGEIKKKKLTRQCLKHLSTKPTAQTEETAGTGI